MEPIDELSSFLDTQSEHDGYEALSGAKMRSLAVEGHTLAIRDEDTIVAVGVVATHRQPDGSLHWSVETVIDRSMRFPAFEDVTLERAIDLVPKGVSMSVWSRRKGLDDALARVGFEPLVSLAYMVVPLPLSVATDLIVGTFTAGDEERLLSINHATFGSHREAGGLDESELAGLMSEPWFEPKGVLFHQIDGVDAAFCWTKIHDSGDGEIYRIGVDPRFQGRGIGKEIVVAGYDHLYRNHAIGKGVLWVDEANRTAVRLYEGLGLRVESRNREFGRASG